MSNQATQIPSNVEGVTVLERTFKSKAHGRRVTQRLYTCANGLQLAALKGGALHMSDGTDWEIATMDERGIVIGDSVGFVGDDQLQRLVVLLAGWGEQVAA